MNYKVLKYFSQGIGHCVLCGDTQGPWGWYNGIGWICDDCIERGVLNEISEKERKAGQISEKKSQNHLQRRNREERDSDVVNG
jgi:hypothetical protein